MLYRMRLQTYILYVVCRFALLPRTYYFLPLSVIFGENQIINASKNVLKTGSFPSTLFSASRL